MLKKEKLKIVRKWYPNAITTIDTINKTIDFVENNLEIELKNVMLADSICVDDVNTIQQPSRVVEFLGPFKLGGLNGFPFVGKTGMSAFASHVPENGAVFIFYGPHIGISKEGNLGEIKRVGQTKHTSCCGAAKAALKKLINNEIENDNISEIDYQMNVLEQILFKNKDRILNSKNLLFETTEVIYEAIDERIKLLVSQTEFNCKYLILVGSILINSDLEIGSFAANKKVEIIDLQKGTSKLLPKLFK